MFRSVGKIITGLFIVASCPWLIYPVLAGDVLTGNERLCVSLMKKAPLINGKLDNGEWDAATQMDSFLFINEKQIDPRCGKTLVGYDNEKLYMAVSSELPPDGKLVATVKTMGGDTVYDDSIEVWIDPFRPERLKGDTQRPYYQFIGNSLGFFFEQKFMPGAVPDSAWRGNWNFKNEIAKEGKRWNAELSIAWKDLGFSSGTEMNDREIGVLILRNWKRPWNQAKWFKCKAFDNVLGYPVLKLGAEEPSISMDLGEIFKGKFTPKISVRNNSGKTVEYSVEAFARHSDMPDKTYSQTQAVEPNGKKEFILKEDGDGFHPDAEHTVEFKVVSKDGKEIFLQRTLAWKYPVGAPYPWKIEGASQDSGLMIAYYPSLKKLRIQTDAELVSGSQVMDELSVELLDGSGKKLKSEKFKMKGKTEVFVLEIPDLDDGSYTLKADFISSGKVFKTAKKDFERIHFPWEGNSLGISDKVYPPFTSIKVSGNKLNVVLREYGLNKIGLPESIVAKGNEILTGNGMELGYVNSAGENGKWSEVSGKFTRTEDTEAIYEGRAGSKELNVKAVSRIEYDGCAKVELSITPAKENAEIKEFHLDIPLKPEIASLYHVCQASLRSNPAGKLPDGEGVIWDSTKTGHGAILGTFLPYVWIGCEEEGLAWFADNDKGWVLDDKTPCMKIIREKDRIVLRILFVNKPVKISGERKIVFGWQASPTKPMPEQWRKRGFEIPCGVSANRYWGIRPSYSGKYPDGHDYSFADQLLIARKRKVGNGDFLKSWYEKHYGDVTDKKLEKDLKDSMGAGMHGKAVGAGKTNTPLMLYLEEHYQDQCSPEWRTFQDEWGWNNFTAREWLKKIMNDDESCSGIPVNPSKSYQDFVLWEAVEWLRRGIGIYCDNTFLRQTSNMFMTEAYRREDGNIQLSSGFWDMREYHKRIWVLTQECKPITEYPLLVCLHMTNTQLIPINTWDDINLDIEWQWAGGSKPFPPDFIRTETMGRQTGSYPHALQKLAAKNWYASDQKDKEGKMMANPDAVRHEWGIRIVHEILRYTFPEVTTTISPMEKLVRDFGYGEPDCKIYNYWDKDYPVSVSSADVKSIALERNGKLLIVLTSWLETPCDIKVGLERDLKKYVQTSVVDAESGTECKMVDGHVPVTMGKYGVAILSFGGRQK